MALAPSHYATPIRPLRLGLIVERTRASKYVYDLAKWARTRPDILALTHLIIAPQLPRLDDATSSSRPTARGHAFARKILQLLLGIERHYLREAGRYKDHLAELDLATLLPETLHTTPIITDDGARFSSDDISAISGLNLDLLITWDCNNLRGDILTTPALGVVSLDHCDGLEFRGGPAGFWEVYFRCDTTGFCIRRLTDKPDESQSFLRGHFQTAYHYLLNQAILFERSSHYLQSFLERVATTGSLPPPLSGLPFAGKMTQAPTAAETISYILRLLERRATRALHRHARIAHQWHVAYTKSDWKNAILCRGIRIDTPRGRLLADPFVVTRGERSLCFAEEMDLNGSKGGTIAAYELTSHGVIRMGTALEEDFHLSFPYIFEYRDELYMCPEASRSGAVRVYKCIEFPLRWRLEKLIMQNVSAADTMLFERNGRWWMFTNLDPVGDGDHCTELSIFHAASPLADDWVPHPLNPIFVDASRARNAGLLRDGSSVFRVSQGQGFDLYGKRTLINEVVELTESAYAERTVSIIAPSFAAGAVGTHHLHSNGTVTAFDFATFSRLGGPPEIVSKVVNRLRRQLRIG